MEYSAVYIRSGDWWAATIEEIPGVNAQGRTLEEARENLQEALQMILEVLHQDIAQSAHGRETIRESIRAKAS